MNETMVNKETLDAIEDASNGKVERCDSLESMWAVLDKEEQEDKELNVIADKRLNDGQAFNRISLNDL